MSAVPSEYEWEALPDLEFEQAWAFQQEGPRGAFERDGDFEQEQFFGKLASLAKRARSSPALKRLAQQAARSALASLSQEGEGEFEWEGDGELSRDSLYSPVRKVYADAMIEHMAHRASLAESESEAVEAFLPLIPLLATKLAPLAAKALPALGKAAAAVAPKVINGVMKVAPQLTRGVNQVVGTLHRNPTMRPFLRVIPQIARNTTAQVARQIAQGQKITPQAAMRILAGQAANTLAHPAQAVRAYQRGKALDRAVHTAHPQLTLGPRPSGQGPLAPSCPSMPRCH